MLRDIGVPYLPEELKDQVKAAMRAAFRLPAKEGMARLEKQAQWLEHEYPSVTASLREGLAEMFIVNHLELSPSLARCLCSTNVICSVGSLPAKAGLPSCFPTTGSQHNQPALTTLRPHLP